MESRPSWLAQFRDWLRRGHDILTGQAADPIAALMLRRAGEARRGEYEWPVGIITDIQTPAGWIAFQNGTGPSMARFFSDSRIDLLDAWEWNGLPDRLESRPLVDDKGNVFPENLCPDCKGVCIECCETGHPADHVDIHGKTQLIAGVGREFQPGERPCVYTYGCGGTGMQGDDPCGTCDGTGRVKCQKCAGTGMMSTGRTAEGKPCPSCGGYGKKRDVIKQDIDKHRDYEVEALHPSYMCAGPILQILLKGPDRFQHAWVGKVDEEGHYPYIVSKTFTRGARVVILGGILRPANPGEQLK